MIKVVLQQVAEQIHVFLLLEPAGLPGLVADIDRDHGALLFIFDLRFANERMMHLVELLLPLNEMTADLSH